MSVAVVDFWGLLTCSAMSHDIHLTPAPLEEILKFSHDGHIGPKTYGGTVYSFFHLVNGNLHCQYLKYNILHIKMASPGGIMSVGY